MHYDKNGLVSGKSALIIGATGQTGRHLLQNLLISPHFTRVGEYGRRLTPAEHIINGKDKLEQKAIDFEKLQESGLKQGNWDVVFITYVAI
jgi:oxidoreductase